MFKSWPAGCRPTLQCSSCGKAHVATQAFDHTLDQEACRVEAERLATTLQLDVPTALSVLLGFLPRARARTICDDEARARAARATAWSEQVSPADAAPAPDPRAPRTVSPVRLPVSVAAPRESSRATAVVAVVSALLVGLLSTLLVVDGAQDPLPPPPAPRVLRSLSLDTDAAGGVTRIVASDPSAVLLGLLQLDPALEAYDPVEVVVLPEPDLRLGIVREREHPTTRLAFEIRREGGQALRWTAGDGTRRVQPHPAPALPDGTASFPVVPPQRP
jgi:hypothetical protein